MKKMSRSPDRYSFQKRSIAKKLKKANNKDDVAAVDALIKLFDDWKQRDLDLEENEDWKKNNMSYDLCTTDWILAKVQHSKAYAQNLYAAMCNNRFQKLEPWPILKEEYWSCSWRSAGGIIADMRQEGDYIDWYCSGISNKDHEEIDFQKLTKEEQEFYLETKKYVSEATVTKEIEKDLQQLGWRVITDDNESI